MNNNLCFHQRYTYQNVNLEKFLLNYFLRKKKDPNVIQISEQDNLNKVKFMIKKRIPYYLQILFNSREIEYFETLSKFDTHVEIDVWQELGQVSIQMNMAVNESDDKKNVTLSAIFNINSRLSQLFKNKISSFIKEEFLNERKKELHFFQLEKV